MVAVYRIIPTVFAMLSLITVDARISRSVTDWKVVPPVISSGFRKNVAEHMIISQAYLIQHCLTA